MQNSKNLQKSLTRLYLLLAAVTAALAGTAVADNVPAAQLSAPEHTASVASGQILIMGDSISAGYGIQREQGWVHLLDEALVQREEPWRVVNASISGETTGGGLARLEGVLRQHDPEIVIIELGGNDGLRGYPIGRIRDNLTAMVNKVQSHGARAMLAAMRIPPNYGPRYTQAFDQVFAEVAAAENVPLIPFLLESVALQEGLMQDDGIHPTAEAQPLLMETVWDHLRQLLETH